MARRKNVEDAPVFQSYQHAADCLEEYNEDLRKVKKAYILAIITTVLWLVLIKCFSLVMGHDLSTEAMKNFVSLIALILLAAAPIMSIVTYIIGGGVVKAIKIAFGIMALGWVILPFPFDIITGVSLFFIAIAAFFCVPIFILFLRHRDIKKDIASAEEFMRYNSSTTDYVESYETNEASDQETPQS